MIRRKRDQTTIQLRHPDQAMPVPIVSDGLVARQDLGEGRMVPAIILDTSARPDIEGVVQAHLHLGSGDIRTHWPAERWRRRHRVVRLVLEFRRPSRCVVFLEFDLEAQGILVDQILHARGLWIQTGRQGDRLKNLLDCPALLVEVPSSREFRRAWEPLLQKAMIRRFRRRGLGRARAKRAGRRLVARWRETFQEQVVFGRERIRSDDEDPQ